MKLKIKRTDDLDQVIRLCWAIFPTDNISDIFTGSVYAWIVWDNDKPVGFATLTEIDEEIIFLSRAGILPSYRGKGLQRRLINARTTFSKRFGYKKAITYVLTNNPTSSNNLFRCGFRLYDPEFAYAGRGQNYFMKELMD